MLRSGCVRNRDWALNDGRGPVVQLPAETDELGKQGQRRHRCQAAGNTGYVKVRQYPIAIAMSPLLPAGSGDATSWLLAQREAVSRGQRVQPTSRESSTRRRPRPPVFSRDCSMLQAWHLPIIHQHRGPQRFHHKGSAERPVIRGASICKCTPICYTVENRAAFQGRVLLASP